MSTFWTAIGRYLAGLALVLLVAVPATAQDQRVAPQPELRQTSVVAAQELAARPSNEDAKLLRSAAFERSLARHEGLLRQAQGIDRMDRRRAQALVDALVRSEDQLIQTIESSIAWQNLDAEGKQSCVDERQECKQKHGAFKGCGIQFGACLIAKIRGKADELDPVILQVPTDPVPQIHQELWLGSGADRCDLPNADS